MDFRGSRKNPSLICISGWDQPAQGPVSGYCSGTFLQDVSNNEDPPVSEENRRFEISLTGTACRLLGSSWYLVSVEC